MSNTNPVRGTAQTGQAPVPARSATAQVPSKSPFGANDEIGMLNLITEQSRASVLARVDGGQVFDISVDYWMGMPSWTMWGDPTFQMWMTHTPAGSKIDNPAGVDDAQNDLVAYSGDALMMYTHCGTHIDTLNHFGYRGQIWNGYRQEDFLGSRGWTVAGADKHPPIIARCVLLDIAASEGLEILPPSFGIDADVIQRALRHQGSEIHTGDVVLLRTGQMQLWESDPAAFMTDEPGLNLDGAKFLAESGAIVIGADNMALEQLPGAAPDNYDVVHTYLLAEAGVPILELANLEAAAASGRSEFAFVGACLKLRGATGSPIRPMLFPLS